MSFFFFFFNDTATTEIYTLSLHDALPICGPDGVRSYLVSELKLPPEQVTLSTTSGLEVDRKSTRLNSSHDQISYAVFCLKKKKKHPQNIAYFPLQETLSNLILSRWDR